MKHILAIGECMVELDAQAPLSTQARLTCQVGGDVFNTLVCASQLGAQTGLLTNVALDSVSGLLLEAMNAYNIDTSAIKKLPKTSNGLYITLVRPEDKSHEFIYYRQRSAASMLHPEQITPELIQDYQVVYASGITQAISPTARKTVFKSISAGKSSR